MTKGVSLIICGILLLIFVLFTHSKKDSAYSKSNTFGGLIFGILLIYIGISEIINSI